MRVFQTWKWTALALSPTLMSNSYVFAPGASVRDISRTSSRRRRYALVFASLRETAAVGWCVSEVHEKSTGSLRSMYLLPG